MARQENQNEPAKKLMTRVTPEEVARLVDITGSVKKSAQVLLISTSTAYRYFRQYKGSKPGDGRKKKGNR